MAAKSRSSEQEPYRIDLPDTGDWPLHDLYRFPHDYEQCYAFVYCLDTILPARDRERINEAFEAYPWKGGYSYVNIYTVLLRQVPARERPRLRSIHKDSPGWIDLALNLDVAVEIAKAVALIAASGAGATAAYSKAYKLLANLRAERERAKLRELRFSQQQLKVIRGSCDELAKIVGFKNLEDLHQRTGNPEVSLKLLASYYRRLRTLFRYQAKGKAILPLDDDG